MDLRKKQILAASVLAVCMMSAGAAEAQVIRGARENVSGGVTAGGAHDVRGVWGGRAVGEGGVVTNGDGDGAGIGGSRGCASNAIGASGCRRGTTTWDVDGSINHESDAVFEGAFGGYGSGSTSFTRDDDGDISSNRSGEYNFNDRTYSFESTYESGEGVDRSVSCSGSSCR